ncbi:type II toxin-antitoxin system VapC family toxin [Scytonema sp. NUACC26]|uniref:type II toxin-antitoxin system VapC family toxin n=1 Tax=Scytonema sp. NUACC26 TaxID=3140176 RepID=UPI0034DC644E
MMTTINYVVDTSVFIKQFIPDPLSQKVDLLLSYVDNTHFKFFVPELFYIECTNTLWKYVRARLYPTDKVATDLTTLKGFSLNVVSTVDLMEDAAQIAIS